MLIICFLCAGGDLFRDVFFWDETENVVSELDRAIEVHIAKYKKRRSDEVVNDEDVRQANMFGEAFRAAFLK